MDIRITTIPHNQQRYDTCGDWQFNADGSILDVKVSALGNEYYEALIGLHEMVEALLCKKMGVDEKAVTAYDIKFEQMRELFPQIVGDAEPGNMEAAPYNDQHVFATQLETLMFKKLGFTSWKEYADAVNALHKD